MPYKFIDLCRSLQLSISISDSAFWCLRLRSTNRPEFGIASGSRHALDFLRHLLGAVVGQAEAHDGQHHGDLVEAAALRLHLNLAGYLPLQTHRRIEGKKRVSRALTEGVSLSHTVEMVLVVVRLWSGCGEVVVRAGSSVCTTEFPSCG